MALKLNLSTKNEEASNNLIILIHGLGASDSTWIHDRVSWIDLFLNDPTFKSLDVAEITYDTSHLANGLLASMGIKKIKIGRFRYFSVGKGPCTNIEVLARELKREIDAQKIKQYKNVILIGHSMGGLIAVRYILEELEHDQLLNIKGMISLATPYNGSSIALYNQLLKSVNKHAQIPSLEPNSNFLDGTIRLWQKHLDRMNIEFKFFFGTEDNIVPENSAIPHIVSSKWTEGIPLPGNHSGILEVKDYNSTNYIHISEAIKKIFEKDNLIKKKRIDKQRALTLAKSITRLKANGLDRDQAIDLLEKKTYDFEYLKPTDEKRLIVIVGEFGIGKSFAIDKIHLDLLSKAENDFNFPIPISINAAQLESDIQKYLENIIGDNPKEQWIIIDGMDEVSISFASNILDNMRIATERWNKIRIILTSRPLSIWNNITEKVSIKELSEEESLQIINLINKQQNHLQLMTLSADVRAVIRRPLFAIILGLYLCSKSNLIPNTRGELLAYLTENALKNIEINESYLKRLLMELAIISISKGNIPIKKHELGDDFEVRNLLDSGIVIEENGYVSFVLPILSQWFAAKALAENMTNIEHIIDSGNLDYWKYPLIILITLFKESKIDYTLHKIVEKNPDFASILIEESVEKWGIHNKEISLSTEECGSKIKIAMDAWVRSLGLLATYIAPVDINKKVLPIGLKKSDEWLNVSWYKGKDKIPAINVLAENRKMADWPSLKSARPGDGAAWYWRWTLEELRSNLTKLIKKKSLPICTEIIYKELMWNTTLKIMKKGSFYTQGISIKEIKAKLKKDYQFENDVVIKVDKKYVSMKNYIEYIDDLEKNDIELVQCPLPESDIEEPEDNWVWSSYSVERIYLRTMKIYEEVIKGYKEVVETLFSNLKDRLRTYKLYPFLLKGVLEYSQNEEFPDYPSLKWCLEPLPSNSIKSLIEINISKTETENFDFHQLDQLQEKIKEYRPKDWTWLSAMHHSQILNIFGSYPVTDTIYEWLEGDLKRINWVN